MRYLYTALLMAGASTASASSPTLGGAMSHLLITVFQNQVYLSFESPSMATVVMQDAGDGFDGAPSVLNNSGYNGQFGWLANGFISLPTNTGIFVRTITQSPHLNVYEADTFAAILGTDGSEDVWQWDGTMTHNWYSTDVHGTHFARYEVYVGDAMGNPLDTYTSGTIDLAFEYGPDLSHRIGVLGSGSVAATPTPGVLSIGGLGLLIGGRRRR